MRFSADPAYRIGGDDARSRPALAGPAARLAEDQNFDICLCLISNRVALSCRWHPEPFSFRWAPLDG